MVIICPSKITEKDELIYEEHYKFTQLELSIFQKFAIKAIVDGHHSLSCVPTGSGKTITAIFAIHYFTNIYPTKRIIYTTPIKSLSNQKYYELTRKFPHLSIGLLTGDIKLNTEAQVLIMTAEILQNSLLAYYSQQPQPQMQENNLHFTINYDTELSCVIHDEVHFINDKERGQVWENNILLTPNNTQLVMLSATLDKPEKFAEWIEENTNKLVYLSCIKERPIPLTHYAFITCNSKIFKLLKNDDTKKTEINALINKLQPIQSANGIFNEINYHKIRKMLKYFKDNQIRDNRQFVLNRCCEFMKEKEMFPAVCFILSKNQIKKASKEITTNLLEDDSKIPYIIANECEQLLRNKIPNFTEYLQLEEYQDMISLLEKGIAIHHSGVIPILREIVEILFEKGYIKLLFATETFAIGLNMPIKTAIFTNIKKFDGNEHRTLFSHEYTQASGRAGRRGIDKVGNVIHLHNLFDCTIEEYRNMLNGQPQILTSKFKFSYNLIFSSLQSTTNLTKTQIINYCNKSLLNKEINSQLSTISINSFAVNTNEPTLFNKKTIVEKYILLCDNLHLLNHKKRKQVEREIANYKEQYKFIDKDKDTLYNIRNEELIQQKNREEYENTQNYISNCIHLLFIELTDAGFISQKTNDEYHILELGNYAKRFNEINCIVFSQLFVEIAQLNTIELIALFSCITNIQVSNDEQKTFTYAGINTKLKTITDKIMQLNNKWSAFETVNNIQTGIDYTFHYDLIDYMQDWCNCINTTECNIFIKKLEEEKGIYLGDFIKAVIKINAIMREFDLIAQEFNYFDFSLKLREIPQLTLKFVISEQSLYI